MRVRGITASLLIAVTGLFAIGAADHHHSPIAHRLTESRGPILGVMPMLDFDEQAAIQVEVDAYLSAEWAKVTAYLDALAETQRQVDAYLWAIAHPPRPVVVTSTPSAAASVAVSGDCAPVAAVVGWGVVNRESTGNPGVVNASDHRGCAQISGGWWSGACSGLNWTNVNDQAACAQIVLDVQGPSAWQETWGG